MSLPSSLATTTDVALNALTVIYVTNTARHPPATPLLPQHVNISTPHPPTTHHPTPHHRFSITPRPTMLPQDAHHLSSVQSSSQRDLFAGGRASTSPGNARPQATPLASSNIGVDGGTGGAGSGGGGGNGDDIEIEPVRGSWLLAFDMASSKVRMWCLTRSVHSSCFLVRVRARLG